MAVATVSTGVVSFTSTATPNQPIWKALATAAGFPTPITDSSANLMLTYQFTNGTGTYATTFYNLLVVSNAIADMSLYETWNTGTLTGTGQGVPARAGQTANNGYTYSCFQDPAGNYGIATAYRTSAPTLNVLGFGFIKVQNPLNGYSANRGSMTLPITLITGNASLATWQSTTSQAHEGTAVQPDPLSNLTLPSIQGLVSSTSRYVLAGPVPVYSGGVPIGYLPSEIVYGPNFNVAPAADRIIITAGVEEYQSLGGSLWIRVV